jgi:hypothetical protein
MIRTKRTLIGTGIFLALVGLYGGYRLHKIPWAILELPVVALIFYLRWREADKENAN